ncbi:MAG: DUF2961 domain-containing protein [Pirellulales bacterium]|nr:DUF2961 domain-containing protein [Pirellulales bacterium]
MAPFVLTFHNRCILSITAGILILLLALPLSAQELFEGLAKPLPGRSRRATSSFRKGADGKYDPRAEPLGDPDDERSNYDAQPIAPGGKQVLMDAKGPGVITHFWFTFPGPSPKRGRHPGNADHQELLLRIYWDGSDRPGVEAPLGDFFANCFGKRSAINSLPVVVQEGDSYNCYWHMPFRKSARVEVVNQSDRPMGGLYYNIDWIQRDVAEDAPYFYAQYRQEYPQEGGKDYVILDTQGKGHYVGTVLAIRMRSPIWYGEGDEKIYIDGEKTPSIWGTGTEDYFCCAYGLATTETLYFGVPYWDPYGYVGNKTSAYRWHLADPIVFEKSIKVTIEHRSWISADENPDNKKMSWNEREDDYASVAFWYQTGTPTFTARSPDAKARRLPPLERIVAYAKDFTAPEYHSGGSAHRQFLPWLFDRPILLYNPEKAENAWVEIPFEVKRREPLHLLIVAACAPDYGTYQATLDGAKIGPPLDFYSENLADREFHLLDFWPDAGKHVLRLECVGQNPRSQGRLLGLHSVQLRERRPRVEKYGHDKDNDWRKNPLLYSR